MMTHLKKHLINSYICVGQFFNDIKPQWLNEDDQTLTACKPSTNPTMLIYEGTHLQHYFVISKWL